MDIKRIGVVGSGAMGTGIAHVAALSGFQVMLHDIDEARLNKSVATMDGLMQRNISKGKLTEAERQATLARITTTTTLADFAGADWVIEAIYEDLAAKKQIFSQLDGICRPEVVLCTNTSSMSITEIAAVTGRPAQVCGLHFFNPAQVMKLVEVIRGYYTSDATVAAAKNLCERFGKTAVEVRKDAPGFIVNRILMMLMIEAVKVVEEGIATPEDVDKAITLGLNHPMGPFTLMDFTGNDINHNVMDYFYQEFRDPHYAPPQLMKQLVRAGRLGRKTGKGFYDYTPS